MEGKEARQKLLDIFGSQKIKFNKDFDGCVMRLKEGMLNDFMEWCRRCKENKELGSVPQKNELKHLYVFFKKIASDVRVTLIKKQNNGFIELRIEGHKAYDETRLNLGYKKSSYYGS